MTIEGIKEVRPSSQEVVGSGIKPLRTFFDERTGIVVIKGIETEFDSATGILKVTDRSARVYAKLQDLFDSIRLVIPEVNESNLQPPPVRVTRINELVAA